MKILYRQSEKDETGSLSRFGVQQCYFKEMSLDRDRSRVTKKNHSHTGFEMHIVTDGWQEYDVAGTTYRIEGGQFLLIYPNVPHTVIASTPHTHKYSITFNKQTDGLSACFLGSLTRRMSDNTAFVLNETLLEKEISATLIENNILEILVSTFRMLGIKEKEPARTQNKNAMISIAKQYIDDNIETAPSVANVSEYCHLSAKQLTRIFQKFEGVTPGEYMLSKRVAKIEVLLADPSLSLKQISEIMNFDNEYYFNSFFKKHAGLPPGSYRKMMGQ